MLNPYIPSYFKTSLEIIRLAVMMYVRYPLSLHNVEDLLQERGIDLTDVNSRLACSDSQNQVAFRVFSSASRVRTMPPQITIRDWLIAEGLD